MKKKICVLIVEDDRAIRRALVVAFTSLTDAETLVATRAQEGFDALQESVMNGVDVLWLVWSDVDMVPQEGDTVRNGLDLLREAKGLFGTDICTVCSSGRPHLGSDKNVLPAGVDHYAPKPVSPETIKKIFDAFCDSHSH